MENNNQDSKLQVSETPGLSEKALMREDYRDKLHSIIVRSRLAQSLPQLEPEMLAATIDAV